MRLLARPLIVLAALVLSSQARAQAPGSADAGAAPPPAASEGAVSPVTAAPAELAAPPAPPAAMAPPPADVTAAPPLSPPSAGAPVALDEDLAVQTAARQRELADAWVAFEAERDARTRSAERVFFPLTLAVQAGLGAAYAFAAEDVTKTSRIIAGATAGLSLAAMVPSILTRSRTGRRAWFSAGAASFAFGAGATFITANNDGGDGEFTGRWVGASVALQGLAFLPLALIPGFPEEEEYEAYKSLPAHERSAAAAKLLARIDRFEQRVTAISVFSAVAGAAVLAAGALVSDDRDSSRTLAGLSLIPIGTIVAMFGPRLFVRNRTDRFAVGDRPTKLPFNGW
jgi:hypothetical protein